MRRIVIVLVLFAASISVPPVVAGSDNGIVSADLEGTPIPAADVGRYYCHDRDFPAIHCYRTGRALESAMAMSGGALVAAAMPSGTYVVIYSLPSYAGSYMYVTQNYDTLVLVGWNDRIRSFKGKDTASATFWTDWFATGARLDFCCNAQIPFLNAAFDQQITSVYRH